MHSDNKQYLVIYSNSKKVWRPNGFACYQLSAVVSNYLNYKLMTQGAGTLRHDN